MDMDDFVKFSVTGSSLGEMMGKMMVTSWEPLLQSGVHSHGCAYLLIPIPSASVSSQVPIGYFWKRLCKIEPNFGRQCAWAPQVRTKLQERAQSQKVSGFTNEVSPQGSCVNAGIVRGGMIGW